MSWNGKCTNYKKNSRQKLHVRKRDLKTKKSVERKQQCIYNLWFIWLMTWFKDQFHQHQYHHHLNIANAVYFIYMYMYVLCDLKILISQCEMTFMIKIFYIKDLLSSSLEHWFVKIPDLLNKGSFTYFIIFHSINRSGGCVDTWPIKRTL